MPHVFFPGALPRDNADALLVLLEALIDVNVSYLRSQKRLGRAVPRLYEAGVTYGRTDDWLCIPAIYARGYADCKSLTCALVAEYRLAGIPANPVHRHRWRGEQTYVGQRDFHILVQTDSGYEDPSKVLGMGKE